MPIKLNNLRFLGGWIPYLKLLGLGLAYAIARLIFA
jgi:hypothetical protein